MTPFLTPLAPPEQRQSAKGRRCGGRRSRDERNPWVRTQPHLQIRAMFAVPVRSMRAGVARQRLEQNVPSILPIGFVDELGVPPRLAQVAVEQGRKEFLRPNRLDRWAADQQLARRAFSCPNDRLGDGKPPTAGVDCEYSPSLPSFQTPSYTNFGYSLCTPAGPALRRPPGVAGVRHDRLPVRRQDLAAVHQQVLQRIQIGTRAVGDRLVDQRPPPLGRVQLRRGGGAGRPGRSRPEAPAGWPGASPRPLPHHRCLVAEDQATGVAAESSVGGMTYTVSWV